MKFASSLVIFSICLLGVSAFAKDKGDEDKAVVVQLGAVVRDAAVSPLTKPVIL